jgi:oligoendopeptidase F
MQSLRDPSTREMAVDRYLSLLGAGGSAYPMDLLARAGVDLSQPDTVKAVATELDALVSKLEAELK